MKRILFALLTVLLLLSFSGLGGLSVPAQESEVDPAPALQGAAAQSAQAAADLLGITPEQYAALREKLYAALYDFADSCDITEFGIVDSEAAREALNELMFREDPAVFQLERASFWYHKSDRVIFKIEFIEYKYEKQTYHRMMDACRKAAQQMTGDLIGSGLGQAETALLLHDRLALWCQYDIEGAGSADSESNNIYGTLGQKYANCKGYTKAYQYLLAQVGIYSRPCSSESLNHVWNIVEIDGELFHADVTWDDPMPDKIGYVGHDNFLRSTEGMRTTKHTSNDFDTTPQNTRFDDAWWITEGVKGACWLLKGTLYYVNGSTNCLCSRSPEGETAQLLDLSDRWMAGETRYWLGNYAYLAVGGDYLYYNTKDSIRRYDPDTGEVGDCYFPDLSGFDPYHYIYAFTVVGNDFVYVIYDTPNFPYDMGTGSTFTTPIPSLGEPVALSLTAPPLRQAYAPGADFNGAGLVLQMAYSDGVVSEIKKGFSVEFDSGTVGKVTVTLTFRGFTAQFTVTVTDMLGDPDGDGAITSTDARLALQGAVNKLPDGALDSLLTDVDGDEAITSTDARLILQKAVNKIRDFPANAKG